MVLAVVEKALAAEAKAWGALAGARAETEIQDLVLRIEPF